jgi:hypothetical protein
VLCRNFGPLGVKWAKHYCIEVSVSIINKNEVKEVRSWVSLWVGDKDLQRNSNESYESLETHLMMIATLQTLRLAESDDDSTLLTGYAGH